MYLDGGVTNKYKNIAHFYCISGEHLTVHEVDCLGEETVLVPDCPGICGSEAPARWQKFKKGVTWMRGIQSDFLSPFPHSGCIQFLKGGQGSTNNSFSSPNRSL